MRKLFFLCLFISAFSIQAQTTYETKENISYYTKKQIKGDNYKAERCVLDIYYPTNKENFATVVWFHGGGLSGGEKFISTIIASRTIKIFKKNIAKKLGPSPRSWFDRLNPQSHLSFTFKKVLNTDCLPH